MKPHVDFAHPKLVSYKKHNLEKVEMVNAYHSQHRKKKGGWAI